MPAGQPAPRSASIRRSGSTFALAGGICALAIFAVSAVLPGVAASRARAAYATAASAAPGALRSAEREAQQASRLDPLSDAGPLAASSIAVQAGDLRLARSDLLEAVVRWPDDWQAWLALARADGFLHQWRQILIACRRVVELNPKLGGSDLVEVALRSLEANLALAPPAGSATATP